MADLVTLLRNEDLDVDKVNENKLFYGEIHHSLSELIARMLPYKNPQMEIELTFSDVYEKNSFCIKDSLYYDKERKIVKSRKYTEVSIDFSSSKNRKKTFQEYVNKIGEDNILSKAVIFYHFKKDNEYYEGKTVFYLTKHSYFIDSECKASMPETKMITAVRFHYVGVSGSGYSSPNEINILEKEIIKQNK